MTRVLACVLALAAGPAFAQPAPRFPVDTLWQAQALNGRDVRSASVTLTVTRGADGMRGAGSTGCNRWMAGLKVGPRRLTLSPIATTRRACPGPLMQIEGEFLKLLAGNPRWRMSGGALVLSGRSGEVRFIAAR